MSEETENPAQDLREVSSSWGDRLANCLMALAVLALMGAGVREYLIHNGKLTSDLNANGFSITNLPSGFFPDAGVTSVNGKTGTVTLAAKDVKALASTGGVVRLDVKGDGGLEVRYNGVTLGAWPSYSFLAPTYLYLSYLMGSGLELDGSGTFRKHGGNPDSGATFSLPSVYEGSYTFAMTSDIPSTDGFLTEESDPTVYDWAKEPEKPSYTPAEIGAAPATVTNEIADLRTEGALVYRLYQGSNVVAEVTNYNSSVHAPELKIMQLNESNEYITVWAEMNGLARTLARAKEYADGATGAVVQAVAPRAWSKVTAGLGFDAPSNTTWLSTGRTVIAGGLEYEKHMTSGGAIWLLESNGMAADFHAQTNNTAFIDLSNADGTPIFRVEKTDSFLVGVHVDSVTVDGDTLVCGVGVVAADHPLVRVKVSLESGEWAKEEDGIPASLATVTWSGTTGNWTCRIQNNTGGSTLFAQMEYFQEGGTKIVNSAALDVSEGILCTDGIHKCRPVYNNGTRTWEVVQ